MTAPFQDCVVLLGDSLTECQDVEGCLQSRMSHAYMRKLDVINRGFGGYTSEWIRPILPRIFAAKKDAATSPRVRLVTIWLGTNDSVLPINERSLTVERFKENMNYILSQLTSENSPFAIASSAVDGHGAAVPLSIILITPSRPVIPMLPVEKRDSRTVENTGRFRQAVLDIGQEWAAKGERGMTGDWAIETLDFWSALIDDAGGDTEALDEYYTDGLHLTPKGYNILWKHVSEIVRERFKGRGVDFDDLDDLPQTLPGTTGYTPDDLATYGLGL